ncbi:MAG: response regulator transcription factor [Firmicutes bacterium]|nr:response regulator transcription factor [Bacillota bacterium]
MQACILVVDDETEILDMVRDALESQGYQVETAQSGAEAKAKVRLSPDLILLDVMLPDYSGFEVCQVIRPLVNCPIIFLSARTSEADRIQGLAVGGDDYLIKPFGLSELRARVHAHLRREERPRSDRRATLRFGDLSLDVEGHTVRVQGDNLPLTPREFDILCLLALHPGQVFSKDQIYDQVWGLDASGDASTVTEHIKKIRSKLTILDPERSYIATMWGVGYKWDVARQE